MAFIYKPFIHAGYKVFIGSRLVVSHLPKILKSLKRRRKSRKTDTITVSVFLLLWRVYRPSR